MNPKQPSVDDKVPTDAAPNQRRSFLKGLAGIPMLGAFSSLMIPTRAAADEGGGPAAEGSIYNLSGQYFESCSCTTAVCPCLFLEDPTEGYCQAFPSWHIEKGNLRGVKLDGLNVAAWLHSPGNLTKGNWRLALYIDDRATFDQFIAIDELWRGKHGGYLQVIASLVSEPLGTSRAQILWSEEGKNRRMVVTGVGEVETTGYEGQEGGDVTLHTPPLAIGPGHPIAISKSKRWSYQDHGIDVLLSDTAGLASAFTYSA